MLEPRRWDEAARDQEPAGDDVLPSDPKEIGGALPIAQTGLTLAQWTQLEALAATLTREQALWISGYFAGIGRPGSVKDVFWGPASAVPAANAPMTVTVLYGSETGNSASLAESLGTRLRRAGLDVRVSDMDSYKVRQLKDEKYLLVVTSTHGEGDPPQSALNFFEYVEGRKAPRLPGLQFAVLALGDSTYERYCEAGKRLDRRLEDLGATRLHPLADCDVDYDGPAAQWIDDVERTLPRQSATTGGGAPTASIIALPAPTSAVFDKRNPFLATIVENIVLTGRGSSKETRHIELSLSGSGLAYQPGDALGFMPRNDPAAVEAILSQAGLDGDILIDVKTGRTALRDALASHFEIVTATPRFLQTWAELSGATELRRLSAPENASERSRFLNDHHVIDILRAFPVAGVAASVIVAALRPLQPRLYSIASSPAAAPDEVHLTVSTVRYDLHGEPRAGVASGYLAASGLPDTTLPVYIQANPHFRLPNDDTAIVMIGAGTGIAPYRAFLQEREARGSAGRSWLFFGERNFRTDFLYQTEWQDHLQSGVLSRIDLAFSRDRAEKTYVQHRIREKARDLYAWLEEGAHLYVCGDAANLAPDIHAALLAVVQEQGHLGPEAAEEYLRGLQRDHRYQRDVY